jgi:hypothetical protein
MDENVQEAENQIITHYEVFAGALERTLSSSLFVSETVALPCTPRVLSWANRLFLAFFAFNEINNLHTVNVAFSSIPTAPTKFFLISSSPLPRKRLGHVAYFKSLVFTSNVCTCHFNSIVEAHCARFV